MNQEQNVKSHHPYQVIVIKKTTNDLKEAVMQNKALWRVFFTAAILSLCCSMSHAQGTPATSPTESVQPTKSHAATLAPLSPGGILSPKRTQGLVVNPAFVSIHDLVILKGPGKFICAEITKQGGSNDLTYIALDIDDVNVVSISIADLKNSGLTVNNPYGLFLLQSGAGLKTFTIGFNSPLIYQKELKLRANVEERGINQISANVIHGK